MRSGYSDWLLWFAEELTKNGEALLFVESELECANRPSSNCYVVKFRADSINGEYRIAPLSRTPRTPSETRHLAQNLHPTCVFAIALCLFCFAVNSEEVESLSLSEAEEIALADEPRVESLITQAEAYDDIAESSMSLPDLQLRSGLLNFPIQHGGFTSEGMTQLSFGVRQNIPPAGQRLALFQKNEHLAQEKREQARDRHLDILLAVRNAWLEAYYQDKAVMLVVDSRELFVDLVDIATSLYSVGERNQNDVVQAEMELSRLDDHLTHAKQSRREAYIRLGQLLGRTVSTSVEDKLPDWNSIPELDELTNSLRTHPKLEAIGAKKSADVAQRRVEEAGLNPKWAFDLGYSYRDGELPNGESRADFLSASVSVSLPLWNRESQRRKMSAASLRAESKTQSGISVLRDLHYELAVAHSRWSTLSGRVKLYEDQLNQQAGENAKATLGLYRNEAVGLSEVARSYIDQINTRLSYERLLVDRLKACAKIDSLVDIFP